MISVNRIASVFQKDIAWAKGNMKILTVMLLPIFFISLFSIIDAEATFAFSIPFTSTFIGIFLTSYLIIEEKRSGTLLALLTSPLRSYELLVSKLCFAMTLCLIFSTFAIFMNKRIDLLASPMIPLNIILFSGTCCFLGCLMGLFHKNEQEMSVLSTIALLVFSGSHFRNATGEDRLAAYFPDHHLTQLLSVSEIPLETLLVHTGFNSLYFLGAIALGSWYTNFYFSNNREKRASSTFFALLAGFIGLYVLSGSLAPGLIKSHGSKLNVSGQAQHKFQTDFWSGAFSYNPDKQSIQVLLDAKIKKIYEIKFKDKDNHGKYIISTREADADESSVELREKKIKEDESRILVGMKQINVKDTPFKQWTYYRGEELIVLAEAFCERQLLQISLDIKDPKMKGMKKSFKQFKDILNNLEPQCTQMADSREDKEEVG